MRHPITHALRIAIAPLLLLLLGCATEVRDWSVAAPSDPAPGLLRVGTSGDYAPFSLGAPDGSLAGMDVELARLYAAERRLRIEFVRFRWSELADDLAANRFDVAWSGVTIRPDRSVRGIFAVPTAQTGAVVLLPTDEAAEAIAQIQSASDLDAPAWRIAVNRGGHLERVARRLFPSAQLLPVDRNEDVMAELEGGRADAVVTDTSEAPHWEARSTRPLRRLGPLTRDRKAPWVRLDQPGRARDLARWLLAREADGTLAAARERAGLDATPTASVNAALEAAVDERLSLMPFVAESKRRSGSPIEVPEREARVIESGLAAVRAETRRQKRPPTPEADTRRFYERLIEDAKETQRRTLAGPASDDEPPDLDAVLRPTLLRIGDRIAFLWVQL